MLFLGNDFTIDMLDGFCWQIIFRAKRLKTIKKEIQERSVCSVVQNKEIAELFTGLLGIKVIENKMDVKFSESFKMIVGRMQKNKKNSVKWTYISAKKLKI